MARKRARILADAITSRLDHTDGMASPRREYTAERESLLAEASEGRLKNGKLRLVDPQTCRMWDGHNRLYDLLTPETCGDLIRSIKAVGRQEMPAIVRPVSDDSGYQYEVICGARRHFAVSHLRQTEHRTDIDYLIDIREISDEEAFRLSDLENREREDISDFERSRDYGRALHHYYDGNKALMAERLGVDRTWLSRYLRIGDLPQDILQAYGDVRDIGIRHAAELSPLLSGDHRDEVLRSAHRIAAQRAQGERFTASLVLKTLKSAIAGSSGKNIQSFHDDDGNLLFTLERKARTHVVTLQRGALGRKKTLMAALDKALD